MLYNCSRVIQKPINLTLQHMTSDVHESVIRKMTRLALQHGAVNLSQGFPDEGPPFVAMTQAASALIGGVPDRLDVLKTKVSDLAQGDVSELTVEDLLKRLYHPRKDLLNQYAIPYGLLSLRETLSKYYSRFYEWDIDPETQITITLGATEAFASTLRALCNPGDRMLIFEPYHELYPNQAKLFYLETEFTALVEKDGKWHIDWDDFEEQALKCKVVVVNTPHNPTGKVFTYEELERIVNFCVKHGLYLVTDEIYEFMTYNGVPHYCLPQVFPQIKDQCVVINSVSKTCSATGWRVGWAIASQQITERIHGVHDQMVLQASTPMQIGAQAFLSLPEDYFCKELRARYLSRREIMIPALRKIGFEVSTPDAAYYAFCRYRNVPKLAHMSPTEASLYLVETAKVATVPGDSFYGRHKDQQGQDYIRFCFVRQEPQLLEAIERLEEHLC